MQVGGGVGGKNESRAVTPSFEGSRHNRRSAGTGARSDTVPLSDSVDTTGICGESVADTVVGHYGIVLRFLFNFSQLRARSFGATSDVVLGGVAVRYGVHDD